MAEAVRIKGLADLTRSFKKLDRDLYGNVRDELHDAAEPVRADAEALARARITNMTLPWSTMRVGGVRAVLVAPKRRRTKAGTRKRPKLAPLLLLRAMQPALDRNEALVTKRLEKMLDRMADKEGF